MIFLSLSGGIMYLMLASSGSNEKNNYESVELSGNNLLSEAEYIKYTGLKDSAFYSEMTLADIKSKLENHPYVIKADIRFDGVNKILAELVEKNPKAVVLNKNKFSLITEDGELLPVINEKLVASLPIISNLKNVNRESLNKADFIEAFKIIDAVRFVDDKMYESLAEINLRNGGDILLLFTGLQFPVVFGKNYEARKILTLNNIWNSLLKERKSTFVIEYIDLRYKNKIFIGKRKSTQLTG